MAMGKDINLRFSKARTVLVLDHPFVGSIALGVPSGFDRSIPTACTDGKAMLFNPDFCSALSDEELLFLIAHECMHPMLEHNFRRGDRDPRTWNQAGDYVINKLLVDEGIGRMPAVGLLSEEIYREGGGTTEGIYELLERKSNTGLPPGSGSSGIGQSIDEDEADRGTGVEEGANSGTGVTVGGATFAHGDPLDECRDFPGSPAEKAEHAATWKILLAQASEVAKSCGKYSAANERLVMEILHPKVDWRDVLTRFMVKCRTDLRSWSRPNRRYLSQGLYLPSIAGETLGELVLAIDCSGSIGENELSQFAAEISNIKEDHDPECIHLVYFDAKVVHYDKCGREDELDIRPHGGGGTAFSPVFRFIESEGIDPVVCVFLTDLCCSDFGDAPNYPVLWVSTYDRDAPFGEVILM